MKMDHTDEVERMRTRRSQKAVHERSQFMTEHQEELEMRKARRQKQLRKRKRKRKILFIEFILLFAVLAGAFWLFHGKSATGHWTVAVFGVDSRDGSLGKSSLADVQMICDIDRETGNITLVSVYRDTYLKINSEGTYHKINEAYFKGGPEQAVSALEENLDLEIDNYVTFNWKAVGDAINILGGIDLEITEKEFAYINSFITETVESTGIPSSHLEHAGMNHLDGVQAVAYARLRLMDTDFNRTERQRKVVSLAIEKAKQADWAVLNNILVTVLPQTSTDVGVDDLIPMARNISKYNLTETAGFPFAKTTKKIGKMDCVVPMTLESNVIQLHQMLYGEENYTPSAAVKKISAKISEDSGVYEEGTPVPPEKPASGNSSNEPTPTEAPIPETTSPSAEETPGDVVITEPVESVDESAEGTAEEPGELPEESSAEENQEETQEEAQKPSEKESQPHNEEDPENGGPGIGAEPTTEGSEKPTRPEEDDKGPGKPSLPATIPSDEAVDESLPSSSENSPGEQTPVS